MKNLFSVLKDIPIKQKKFYKSEILVKDIVIDSRQAGKGSLYVAIEGRTHDGHDYIKEAIYNGAVAVVAESYIEDIEIPFFIVSDSRKAYALMCKNFFDNPQRELKIIGITGTNGKTTVSYIIDAILKRSGYKTGVIGTLKYIVGDEEQDANLTTPDPFELYGLLRKMADNGVNYVTMEISAHALYLSKIYGLKTAVSIFTNLSQDHLDFFETMDEYKKAKKILFSPEFTGVAVINADDPAGQEIIRDTECLKLSYGLKEPSDAFAINCNFNNEGVKFILNVCDEIIEVNSKLYGEFNLYNTLAAATCAKILSIPLETVAQTMHEMKEVSGRFNVVKRGQKTVIIDYAHTPDGLKNVLTAARALTEGKLICVFGCGGNRDTLKRPIMGEIAAASSDFVVVTSDNPRLENPYDIMSQIEKGVKKHTNDYVMIVDRESAIEYALSIASSKDLVVIAGKGAEGYIDEGGTKRPYSDRQSVMSALGVAE